MTSRRSLLKTLALTPLVGAFVPTTEAKSKAEPKAEFIFSLNKFVYSLEFFEAFVVFKINKNLCDKQRFDKLLYGHD